jgi:sporulation integral membrane protein YlbJ
MEVNMLKIDDRRKNKIIRGSILVFLSAILLFPIASLQGATNGLLLWFEHVLPNLLPFIILSNLIVRLNITSQISRFLYPVLGRLFRVSADGCYPIALGFLSGIPMGAKATADLIARQKISHREGQFLLGMCNNASPMFILGYISVTQLKLPQIKYTLFAIIYVSAILSAVLYRILTQQKSEQVQPAKANRPPEEVQPRFSFQLLDASIMNGFEIITKIGGYIILFSILASLLNTLFPEIGIWKGLLVGILEITTGVSQICQSSLTEQIKIVLVSVLTSFGGFSGIAQTKSVLGSSGLSIKSYIIVRLLNAVISGTLAYSYTAYLFH